MTPPLLAQAGGPRIAPFGRLRTKPQTPCTREGRSASLSYRPPLADAAFCNLLAPARSCRGVPPLTPLTSPSTKIRAAPHFGHYRRFYLSLIPVHFAHLHAWARKKEFITSRYFFNPSTHDS